MNEREALVPVDPNVDPESWPQMVLNDVTVYLDNKDQSSEMADLFDVIELGSLRVTGILGQVRRKWRGSVLPNMNPANRPFTIPSVNTYSIEALDNDEIIIWALGRCAWYQLSPSSEYSAIFSKLLEKGRLWLFLLDKYQEYSRKGKLIKGSVTELHKEYAEKYDIPQAAAAELFDKYRSFLIMKMNEPIASTDLWRRTPIYRELSKFKTEWKRIQEIIKNFGDNAAVPSSPSEASGAALASELISGAEASKSTSTSTSTLADASSLETPGTKKATRKIANGRRRKLAKKSDPETPAKERIELLQPSPTVQQVSQSSTMYPGESDTELDSDTEAEPTHHSHSSKGKSVLRPARPPEPQFSLEETDCDDDSQEPVSPTFTSLKRTLDSIPHSASKRIKVESPTSDTHRESSYPDSRDGSWPLLRPGTGKPLVQVTKLPDTGLRLDEEGKWVCGVENCRFEVTTTGDEGKKLIEEHYEEHGRLMKEAMEVIGLETGPTRGVHHVDNLLAKIEEMAQQWANKRPLLGGP